MLKGSVTIQLFDKDTGEKIKEVKGENAFTDALNSLVNDCSFGLGNMAWGNNQVSGSGITDNSPLMDVALGGIQLFGSFDDDEDLYDLYEDLDNAPIAYASRENLSMVGDTKIGTFNPNDSSISLDGKTVSFVYDWLPSQGNSETAITAVGLSHLKCAKQYRDANYMTAIGEGIGYYRSLYSGSSEQIIGVGNGGIFTRSANPSNTVKFYVLDLKFIDLVCGRGALRADMVNLLTPAWSKTYSDNTQPSVCYDPTTNKLYVIYCAGGTSATVTVIDPSNNFSETTSTITISDSMLATTFSTYSWGRSKGDVFAAYGGYLYAISSDYTKLFKINLSSLSDVTDIAFTNTLETSNIAWNISNDGECIYVHLYGASGSQNPSTYIIDPINDAIIEQTTGRTAANGRPLLRKGVWLISSGMTSGNIGKNIVTTYNATKYVLNNPVQKDATMSMRVIYTVTEDNSES